MTEANGLTLPEVVVLDSGPLGAISHPEAEERGKEEFAWFMRLLEAGVVVEIPEIADYEVRRELLRAGKDRSVERLDELAREVEYRPLTTATLRRAASLWAKARREGKPTAAPDALDGDAILAAQIEEVAAEGPESVVVATTNPGHLGRFVDARHWREIEVEAPRDERQ